MNVRLRRQAEMKKRKQERAEEGTYLTDSGEFFLVDASDQFLVEAS